MDTFSAFFRGMANQGKELMVFDWEHAAWIIKERNAQEARAGLRDDWEYTGGAILENGRPVPQEDTYVYLASNWAVPELEIDDERIPCYRMQSETPGWDSGTYWPPEAVEVLGLDD